MAPIPAIAIIILNTGIATPLVAIAAKAIEPAPTTAAPQIP